MATPINAVRRELHMTRRILKGENRGFLSSQQAAQLNSEIQGLGSSPTTAQLNQVSADIYLANQTGRVSTMTANGKITQTQATQLDSDLSNWAKGYSSGSSTFGSIWSLEKSEIQQDLAAATSGSTSASTTAS